MSINGFIVSHTHICEEPLHNRCVTHYQFAEAGHTKDMTLLENSFPDEHLTNGTQLKKNEFDWHYEVNGHDTAWQFFPDVILKYIFGSLLIRVWWRHKYISITDISSSVL
jgi:hypothetical protein